MSCFLGDGKGSNSLVKITSSKCYSNPSPYHGKFRVMTLIDGIT